MGLTRIHDIRKRTLVMLDLLLQRRPEGMTLTELHMEAQEEKLVPPCSLKEFLKIFEIHKAFKSLVQSDVAAEKIGDKFVRLKAFVSDDDLIEAAELFRENVEEFRTIDNVVTSPETPTAIRKSEPPEEVKELGKIELPPGTVVEKYETLPAQQLVNMAAIEKVMLKEDGEQDMRDREQQIADEAAAAKSSRQIADDLDTEDSVIVDKTGAMAVSPVDAPSFAEPSFPELPSFNPKK